MLAGNAAYIQPFTGAMDSITTVVVDASGTSSITFSSIPQTYTHLQIRFMARDNRASNPLDTLLMRFNSDTASNYYMHYLNGNGSTATAGGFSSTGIEVYRIAGATAGTSMFGAGIIDILDYKSTSKNKTSRALSGSDQNGSGEVVLNSGLWFATPAAINTVTLTPTNGSLFSESSSFALYGVRG
jgi:hypothetical protein